MVQNIIVLLLVLGCFGFLIDNIVKGIYYYKDKKLSNKILTFTVLKGLGLLGIITLLITFIRF